MTLEARQHRTGDGRHAHSTAAKDHDGLAALDVRGINSRAQAGHHATAQQARGRRVCLRVDLGALAFVDQGLLGEGTDAERRAELGSSVCIAFSKRHLRGGVVGVEAVLRLALLTSAALAAHRAPIQDHEVPDLNVGDGIAHALDDARRLMPEQEREGILDITIAVSQVRVADAAGLNFDHDIVLAWSGHDDVNGLDGLALGARNHAADNLRALLRVIFI